MTNAKNSKDKPKPTANKGTGKSDSDASSRWPPSLSNGTIGPHNYRGEQCA